MRVVGVRDDVALIGAVIVAVRKSIRHAKREPARQAAGPGQLERVVPGAGHVIRLPDGAEAFIRPERVEFT